MCRESALLISKVEVQTDPALQSGARGARKVIVTDLYAAREQEATEVVWKPPISPTKCSVQVTPRAELAVFNQHAAQDRHYHKEGTEIYTVLDGTMAIEVTGQDYVLQAGDSIVVNRYAVHEVKPASTEFLCQVITLNCGARRTSILTVREESRTGRFERNVLVVEWASKLITMSPRRGQTKLKYRRHLSACVAVAAGRNGLPIGRDSAIRWLLQHRLIRRRAYPTHEGLDMNHLTAEEAVMKKSRSSDASGHIIAKTCSCGAPVVCAHWDAYGSPANCLDVHSHFCLNADCNHVLVSDERWGSINEPVPPCPFCGL